MMDVQLFVVTAWTRGKRHAPWKKSRAKYPSNDTDPMIHIAVTNMSDHRKSVTKESPEVTKEGKNASIFFGCS